MRVPPVLRYLFEERVVQWLISVAEFRSRNERVIRDGFRDISARVMCNEWFYVFCYSLRKPSTVYFRVEFHS